MTTDSREPRPIEDLVKLDTYQGMTDEEIAMVVEYTTQIAAKNAAFKASQQAQREAEARISEFYQKEAEAASIELNRIAENPPAMEVV